LLTELDALDAVPKTDGFVQRYVITAVDLTSAPLAYHIGSALTILASTCPLDYGMGYAGGILRANLYTLAVGRSGEEQKSTAVGIGRRTAMNGIPQLVGDFPGSAEGLIDSLHAQPSQLLVIGEFGKFLSAAQKGYYEPIKALLADLWDADPIQRAKANKNGARHVVRVDNPRLSILAACSLPYLEKYSNAEDWTGGFMGRWAVLHAQRERDIAIPTFDPAVLEPLGAFLNSRASIPAAGRCVGFDDAATRMWIEWRNDVLNRNMPSNIIGARARAPTIALKTALIHGWDFGPAPHGLPWALSTTELDPAIRFAELHLKSVVNVSASLCETPDARLRRDVLVAVEELGGAVSLGDLLGRLKLRRRNLAEILDSLVESAHIQILRDGPKTLYTLQGADAGTPS
jgi:hypothetical protein